MGSMFASDAALNSEQQALLRSALASNNQPPVNSVNRRPKTSPSSSAMAKSQANGISSAAKSRQDPSQAYPSPDDLQQPISSGRFEEGPLLDFGLDDGNFDWDNNEDSLNLLEDGQIDNDHVEHDEKRKHPDEDDDEQEGSHKRLESEEKASRKPGRKPLNGEPTTKRKAQNRAAQRAFRERKERHLKDLETKVEELEKASESTNHENGRLRAEVERLNVEVKEYRKRLSTSGSGPRVSPTTYSQAPTGISDFQFNFPKFGDLPGSSFMDSGSLAKTSTSPSRPGDPHRSSSGSVPVLSRNASLNVNSVNGPSPRSMTEAPLVTSPDTQKFQTPSSQGFDDLSGLFSPSILESARRSASLDYMGNVQVPRQATDHKESIDSSRGYSQTQNYKNATTDSPSVSSMSHGLNSSCNTTPEPSNIDSPNRKQSEGAPTSTNNIQDTSFRTPNSFLTSPVTNPSPSSTTTFPTIDFLAAQNNNAFDPILFNSYRDPQESILNANTYPSSTSNNFSEFFNDPYLPNLNDFESPYDTGGILTGEPDQLEPKPLASTVPLKIDDSRKKNDLMNKVEEAKEGEYSSEPEKGQSTNKKLMAEHIKNMKNPTYVPCDKLWDRVQTSALARSGEVDMDDLCTQLKSKARCSGNGAVIDQADVDKILGPPPKEQEDFLKGFR